MFLSNKINNDQVNEDSNNQTTKITEEIIRTQVKSKNREVKYPYQCNDCEYQAISKDSLNKHVRAKHEGIKYHCTNCE